MGLIDLEQASYSLAHSPLDSRRFDLDIARASISAGLAIDGATVARDFDELGCDLAIVRFDASKGRLGAELIANGANVMLADALLYFGTAQLESQAERVELRTLTDDDWEETAPVIAATFAEYGNHYAANPLLDADKILAGYLEWAEYHFRSPDCDAFAVMSDGAIGSVALITTQDGTAEISLAGTHPDHQRRGLYEQLVTGVQQHYHNEQMQRLVISTQSHNVGVIRAWEKVQWRYLAGFHTVHLLTNDLVARMTRL